VRALLALYRWLGLEAEHVCVERVLRRPVPYRVRLDLHCHHERMALLMDGYEADLVPVLYRLLDPAGCFLDVGANIGLITIPLTRLIVEKMASALPTRPVAYCLEPVESNYEALCHNIGLNGFSQLIRPLCIGVGETEQTVDIQVEGNLPVRGGTGTANILPSSSTYQCVRTTLPIRTIDNLLASRELPANIKLIKLDTDGYDLFALMGATGLLEQSRPLVFGEFMAGSLAWHGQTIGDVAAFARSLDYDLFARRGRTWRFTSRFCPDAFVQDALLLPREVRQRFSWCVA
jgi:FkbM family methyltransferase